MADKITALTALMTPSASDLIPIVDDPSGIPVTKNITMEDLLSVINTFSTATPEGADKLLIYDQSESAVKGAFISAFSLNENIFINGDAQIAQDGTSHTIAALSSKYPDMYTLTAAGAVPTGTIAQSSFTPGQTDVPGEPEHYITITTSSLTSVTSLEFDIRAENVRTLAGQDSTVSFYAKADAAITLTPSFDQNFGSGGSAEVSNALSSADLTTSWQKFTYPISVPSISGKTIGAGNFVKLTLDIPIGSTFIIDLARFKLEPGSVATESPIAPFGDVLQKCKRYYQKSYNYGTAPGTASQTAGLRYFTNLISNTIVLSQLHEYIQLHEMRTTPTVTIYSYLGTSGQMSNASVDDIGSDSGAGSRIVPQGFMAVNGSTSAYTTSGNLVLYHWAADARL